MCKIQFPTVELRPVTNFLKTHLISYFSFMSCVDRVKIPNILKLLANWTCVMAAIGCHTATEAGNGNGNLSWSTRLPGLALWCVYLQIQIQIQSFPASESVDINVTLGRTPNPPKLSLGVFHMLLWCSLNSWPAWNCSVWAAVQPWSEFKAQPICSIGYFPSHSYIPLMAPCGGCFCS